MMDVALLFIAAAAATDAADAADATDPTEATDVEVSSDALSAAYFKHLSRT